MNNVHIICKSFVSPCYQCKLCGATRTNQKSAIEHVRQFHGDRAMAEFFKWNSGGLA